MIANLNIIPALPEPFGPHKVGTTEWEIPISEIPSSTPVPDPTITTIKFRVFYPTPSSSKSRKSAPWLPTPQREWNQAYASFMGASPRLSSLISLFPFTVNLTSLPAVPDAPLYSKNAPPKFPVVVFSHGLGGNFNAYSAVCSSLASFGIVCVAPEHRDGSAPISLIRSADGRHAHSIHYQRHPHAPTAQVLNARNAQLRIRLWELEHIFTVVCGLNEGKIFSNYLTHRNKSKSAWSLKDRLDLRPGRVTWAGHSFGACTTVQFVKSVYYHEFIPSLEGTEYENDPDWRPLYKPAAHSELVKQITPDSPVALLDLWAMPLRADPTKWLWEKPLPCYDRNVSDETPSNVVSIISAEFYKYTELIHRMKAALSARPAEAAAALERRSSAQSPKISQYSSPQILPTPGNKVTAEMEAEADLELGEVTPLDLAETLERGFAEAEEAAESEAELYTEWIAERERDAKIEAERKAHFEDNETRCTAETAEDSDIEADVVSISDAGSAMSSASSHSSTPASSILSRASSPSPSTSSNTSSVNSDSVVSTQESSEPASTSTSTTSLSDDQTLFNPEFKLQELSQPGTDRPRSSDPKLFLVPFSAHLSQSDFGVLFPKLTRYLMNAEEPVETILLNVRAVLSVMRSAGLDVHRCADSTRPGGQDDDILSETCREKRFVKVDLY